MRTSDRDVGTQAVVLALSYIQNLVWYSDRVHVNLLKYSRILYTIVLYNTHVFARSV